MIYNFNKLYFLFDSFAKFLGVDTPRKVESTKDESTNGTSVENKFVDDNDDDDEQFEMLLDELGVRSVIGSDDQVRGSSINAVML